MSVSVYERSNEGVLDVQASQQLHQPDPNLATTPRDKIFARIESLHQAGNWGVAEALLTELAARSIHNSGPEHHFEPMTITSTNPERARDSNKFTRILDKIFRY